MDLLSLKICTLLSSSTSLISLLVYFASFVYLICLFAGHVTEGSGDAQGQQVVIRGFVIHKKVMCNFVYFVISNKCGGEGGTLRNQLINQSICSY